MVIGIAVVGVLGLLLFGLATGRIDWRQQGCCPADPAEDARMNSDDTTRTSGSTRSRES